MLLFFAFCNASPVFLPLICMLQVSGASTGYKPSNGQYQIYNTTFGYLTVQPGYCSGRTCHVFPAINDEFGCVLDGRSLASIDDRSFGDDMNVLGYTHEALHRCMRGAQCCCVAAPPPFLLQCCSTGPHRDERSCAVAPLQRMAMAQPDGETETSLCAQVHVRRHRGGTVLPGHRGLDERRRRQQALPATAE